MNWKRFDGSFVSFLLLEIIYLQFAERVEFEVLHFDIVEIIHYPTNYLK